MFGIGFLELIVIALVILLVIKPSEYPRIAYELGRKITQCRRYMQDLQRNWEKTFTSETKDSSDE